MAYRFLILFCFIFFTACDDGDIITVELEFDQELELCTNEVESFLIYDTREDPNESLSLFIPRSANQNIPEAFPYTNPTPQDTPIGLTINGSGVRFIYRTYNRALANDELCDAIPPADLNIVEDFEANTGTVEVTVTIADDDNDGVPNEREGISGEPNEDGIYMDSLDTDLDGIPDYLDEDDDNDNVKTINEIDIANEDGDDDPTTNPLNTDADSGDIIPDYLDKDDDGDGVDTRLEDISGEKNPRDGDNLVVDTEGNNVYRYLYSNIAEVSEDQGPTNDNEYTRTVTASFVVKDIDLQILRTTQVDLGSLIYSFTVEQENE